MMPVLLCRGTGIIPGLPLPVASLSAGTKRRRLCSSACERNSLEQAVFLAEIFDNQAALAAAPRAGRA